MLANRASLELTNRQTGGFGPSSLGEARAALLVLNSSSSAPPADSTTSRPAPRRFRRRARVRIASWTTHPHGGQAQRRQARRGDDRESRVPHLYSFWIFNFLDAWWIPGHVICWWSAETETAALVITTAVKGRVGGSWEGSSSLPPAWRPPFASGTQVGQLAEMVLCWDTLLET